MGFAATAFVNGTTMLRSAWETWSKGALGGLRWLNGRAQAADVDNGTVTSENIVRPYVAEGPLDIFDGTIQQASWRINPDTGVFWNRLTDRKDVFFDQNTTYQVAVPGMLATIDTNREGALTSTDHLIVYVQADITVGAWSDCRLSEDFKEMAIAGLAPYLAADLKLGHLLDRESGEWAPFGVKRALLQSYRATVWATDTDWDYIRNRSDNRGAGKPIIQIKPHDKWNFSIAGCFQITDSTPTINGLVDIGVYLDFDRVKQYNAMSGYQGTQEVASQQFSFGPRSLKVEVFRKEDSV